MVWVKKLSVAVAAAALLFLPFAAFASDALHVKEGAGAGIVARHGHEETAPVSDTARALVKSAPVIAPAPSRPVLRLKTGALSPIVAPHDGLQAHGHFVVTALDKNGKVKWVESFDNLVVNTGKNLMLDNVLNTSATASTNVYMGLKSTGTALAADTMASHSSWTELNITASSGARLAPSFSAASSGSKTTSSAVSFSVTSSGTVYGVFIVVGSGAVVTNGSTAGTLFSAGDFGSSRAVINGDTLNVTYTLSV